ncbi:hypothetical protein PAXRUDRAFT_315489 [Paxillus rubicundulus Ve08.2h10]|uniref:Uncharacterized protein n=1 Tax=Paxillus rubicundulus Ve08.2h10 TaxID=930991 RepID=A0A0D0E5V3_9AGAM|nr:hypothetical protein PAXRUDRAFT_315489 [Paxillus rubicundulus Ve08.2h10]
MFMPNVLETDSNSHQTLPVRCQPASARSTICIGDLIAIIGCLVPAVIFTIWVIYRLLRRRQAARSFERQGKGLDPYHASAPLDDSLLVKHGVVHPPNKPEKARTADVFHSPQFVSDLPGPTSRLSPPMTLTAHEKRSKRGRSSIPRQSQATPSHRSNHAWGNVAHSRDDEFWGRYDHNYLGNEDGSPSGRKSSTMRRPTQAVLPRY